MSEGNTLAGSADHRTPRRFPGWLGVIDGSSTVWKKGSVACCLLGVVLLCGCVTQPEPQWVTQGKRADSLYVYQVGRSTQCATPEAAKAAAFQNALAGISREIISSGSGKNAVAALSALPILGADIIPGGIYYNDMDAGAGCAVLVSYPKLERQKLLDRVALGARLNGQWAQVNTLFSQREYSAAIDLMEQKMLPQYHGALFAAFAVEDLQLKLGDAYFERGLWLDARTCYENVLKSEGSRSWWGKAQERLKSPPFPEAPRLWPMRDRWDQQSVALVCWLRKGAALSKFADLSALLLEDFRAVNMGCSECSDGLVPEQVAAFFDPSVRQHVLPASLVGQSGVLLAVLVDIDANQLKAKAGGAAPASLDATARFLVLNQSDGTTVFTGQFPLIAWQQTDARLAGFAANFLSQTLVESCPPLARGLTK